MDVNIIKNNLSNSNNIVYFENIDSTNTYCKQNSQILDDMTLIIADTQTNGRGKNNRTWFSPTGGIYMSLLLKNNINHPTLLPHITSLAIVKAFEKHSINLGIKWPNDIIVHNRKLGGILVESKISSTNSSYTIGIGLNVNSILPSFEIKDKFIALNELTNKLPKNEIIISEITNNIINLISIKDTKALLNEYKKYSILLNEKIYLSSEEIEKSEVTALDINKDGSLKVLFSETNEIKDIYSGEFSITGLDSYI